MARRKIKRKKTTARRIGAVSKKGNILVQAAGAVAGYVVGSLVSTKIAPNLDPKIKGAAITAIGLYGVPMLLKNDIGKGMALGMAVAGTSQVLTSVGVLNKIGLRQMGYYTPGQTRIAGNGITAMLNGSSDGISAMVNGQHMGTRQTVNGGSGINQQVGRRSAMQTALKYA